MTCVHCGKEINETLEKYEPHGYDGDFIHKKCKKPYEKEMHRVLTMTDKQFERWMK